MKKEQPETKMELEKVELQEFELENMTELEVRGACLILADLIWASTGEKLALKLNDETVLKRSSFLGKKGLQFVGGRGYIELLGHEIHSVYKSTQDNLLGYCGYWVLIKE